SAVWPAAARVQLSAQSQAQGREAPDQPSPATKTSCSPPSPHSASSWSSRWKLSRRLAFDHVAASLRTSRPWQVAVCAPVVVTYVSRTLPMLPSVVKKIVALVSGHAFRHAAQNAEFRIPRRSGAVFPVDEAIFSNLLSMAEAMPRLAAAGSAAIS